MLFRLDNPRLIMNAQEFPEHMVLYCLAHGDCAGDVVVNFVDTSTGRRVTQPIRPTRSLEIFERVIVHEYVLPFDQLADPIGRRGATSGFTVIGRSSYRVAGSNYEIRTLEFTMVFPAIGGGIIRMRVAEQEWDIANPTFNPRAAIPEISRSYGVGIGDEYISGPVGIENRRVPDEIIINAYQRTHRGFIGTRASEIEQRRQQRIENFDLQEVPAEPINTPAINERVNVVTGRPRHSEDVERRRQERLQQIRQSEERSSLLIGVDQPAPTSGGPSIVVSTGRKPKTPPKSRFERIQQNLEELNEEPKK